MEVGVGTWTWPWEVGIEGWPFLDRPVPLGLHALLDRAAELDVRVVQVADNGRWESQPPRSDRALADHAERLGITLELATRGVSQDWLRPLIARCAAMRVGLLRTIVDRGEHEPEVDEIVRSLVGLLPLLRSCGVRLALENHDRLPVAAYRAILGSVDAPEVGICLDTVNSLGVGEGPDQVIPVLAPFASCVHVKDVRVRRDAGGLGLVVEGVPLGDGILDLHRLLCAVATNEPRPNLIIEQWMPPLETWESTIARERSWAQAAIVTLRRAVGDVAATGAARPATTMPNG